MSTIVAICGYVCVCVCAGVWGAEVPGSALQCGDVGERTPDMASAMAPQVMPTPSCSCITGEQVHLYRAVFGEWSDL